MPQEESMEVDSSKKSISVPSEKPPPDPDTLTFEDIKEHCRAIERGENTKEPRFINRVLRSLITTRKRLNSIVLNRLINYYFTGAAVAKQKEELLSFIKSTKDEPMDVDKVEKSVSAVSVSSTAPKSPRQQRKMPQVTATLLPEIEAYVHLLVLLYLWDKQLLVDAEKCVNSLMKRLENQNRRSLDPLLAKVFYFYSVISEKQNKLSGCVEFFHTRLRTSTLRHDEDSQATLINCLLRAYLQDKLYELAGKLNHKVSFPESAGNNEWARYHYYVGRINAMELNYSDAKTALQLALRKAPQHTALGFRQTVQKVLVAVELLMGTIPERSLFRQPIYRTALKPYLQIAQGDTLILNLNSNFPPFDAQVQINK